MSSILILLKQNQKFKPQKCLVQFRFGFRVMFAHGNVNSHELLKDVDMVTLQRSILFKYRAKLEQPGILHVCHRPPMWR